VVAEVMEMKFVLEYAPLVFLLALALGIAAVFNGGL
jgi:hypothetical protein